MQSLLAAGMAVTPTVRLVRPLGAGGMGSVWVADHHALHTQVVVKFMAAELSANPDFVARFSREAASAARVKSPHVVQMFDHGVTASGIPFIVMELLDGKDLGQHLEGVGGRMPVKDIAPIITQVAKALARAHESGIVHRDMKPANIFLSDVGGGEVFAKVLDFGVAKASQAGGALSSGSTRTGSLMGTPYYMSPEQLVGAKDVDARCDIWALGILVFEVVTGRLPFEGDNLGALAVQVNSGYLPRPSAMTPDLPPGFDAWFAKACVRDPAGRFASVRELADALERVAQGERYSVDARASAVFERTAPLPSTVGQAAPVTHGGVGFATIAETLPVRRMPVIPIAAAVLAVAVVAVLGLRGSIRTGATATSPTGSLPAAPVAAAPVAPASSSPAVAEPAPAASVSASPVASVRSPVPASPARAASPPASYPKPAPRPASPKPAAPTPNDIF